MTAVTDSQSPWPIGKAGFWREERRGDDTSPRGLSNNERNVSCHMVAIIFNSRSRVCFEHQQRRCPKVVHFAHQASLWVIPRQIDQEKRRPFLFRSHSDYTLRLARKPHIPTFSSLWLLRSRIEVVLDYRARLNILSWNECSSGSDQDRGCSLDQRQDN